MGRCPRTEFENENLLYEGALGCLFLLHCRRALIWAVALQESIPFAVIGSNTVVEARGQRVRGRLYPWGIVEGGRALY